MVIVRLSLYRGPALRQGGSNLFVLALIPFERFLGSFVKMLLRLSFMLRKRYYKMLALTYR